MAHWNYFLSTGWCSRIKHGQWTDQFIGSYNDGYTHKNTEY